MYVTKLRLINWIQECPTVLTRDVESELRVGSSAIFLGFGSWEFDSLQFWGLGVGVESRTKNLSTQGCGVGSLGVRSWEFGDFWGLVIGSLEFDFLTILRTRSLEIGVERKIFRLHIPGFNRSTVIKMPIAGSWNFY